MVCHHPDKSCDHVNLCQFMGGSLSLSVTTLRLVLVGQVQVEI